LHIAHVSVVLVTGGGFPIVRCVWSSAADQDVDALGARAPGAVDVSPLGVANARAGLLGVPGVSEKAVDHGVGPGVVRCPEEVGLDHGVVPGDSFVRVNNVLAGAVAGAIVGAGGALVRLPGVAVETLTEALLAVADALGGAFCVAVGHAFSSGRVSLGNVEGAGAVGATATGLVPALPVLEALADVVHVAGAVATASVRACCVGCREHKGESCNVFNHGSGRKESSKPTLNNRVLRTSIFKRRHVRGTT
jgi:hypothetical protein